MRQHLYVFKNDEGAFLHYHENKEKDRAYDHDQADATNGRDVTRSALVKDVARESGETNEQEHRVEQEAWSGCSRQRTIDDQIKEIDEQRSDANQKK